MNEHVRDTSTRDFEVYIGELPFGRWRTWYRVTRARPSFSEVEVVAKRSPVVVLHGGPGAAHDYLLAYAELAAFGHDVFHYDQIGCGRSTHLPYQETAFWTTELFLDQLETVLVGLGLEGGYHLLGHSWGGMLAVEHSIRRPKGLVSLVLADAPASIPLWMDASRYLREQLPSSVRQALDGHEGRGTLDSPDYHAALEYYYDRHVCRRDARTVEMLRTETEIESDPSTYSSMWGPNECLVTGSLREWSSIDRLHLISVPTLVVTGSNDQATGVTIRPFLDRIPTVSWQEIDGASHNPQVEATRRCLETVAEFLQSSDITNDQ